MLGVGDDPRVFSLLRVPQLVDNLEAILDQLERCQKALADYLEQKRQAFPRFYCVHTRASHPRAMPRSPGLGLNPLAACPLPHLG